MVYAHDLKSCGAILVGSSPTSGICINWYFMLPSIRKEIFDMINSETDKGRKRGFVPAGIMGGEHHSLFETTSVLPVQFFPNLTPIQPEKKLMLAVLEDALHCCFLVGGAEEYRQKNAEAHAWIASDDVSWPFSFERICEALNLSSWGIRAHLIREYKRRGIEKIERFIEKIAEQKKLKNMLLTPSKALVVALKNKRSDWKEAYNVVFTFLLLCFARPKQTTQSIATHLKIDDDEVYQLCLFAIQGIKKGEPYFLDTLFAIADEIGINQHALRTLLLETRI